MLFFFKKNINNNNNNNQLFQDAVAHSLESLLNDKRFTDVVIVNNGNQVCCLYFKLLFYKSLNIFVNRSKFIELS